jgi:hypothetical protein
VSQIIKPKRKHTAGAPTTSDLAANEIAINTSDFSIYVRDDSNNILRVGGVQTPMNQDLDTNAFTLKNAITKTIVPTVVNFGTPIKLPRYTLTGMNALVTIDPHYCVVGRTYKITTPGNTDWEDMGATAGPGNNFQNVIFTATEAAPSGTTGGARFGDDSTTISNEFGGMLVFNTDNNNVMVYKATAYQWITVD